MNATFDMVHLSTTGDKFGYWNWEIDRWGDPTGASTPEPGAWQVVTNEPNDVVLGVWGYWGTDARTVLLLRWVMNQLHALHHF